MSPAALANYQNVLRPMIGGLFADLMVYLGINYYPDGRKFNNVSWGHTFRQQVEVNSLNFFNPGSKVEETLEVTLSHTHQFNPIITVTGPDGTQVIIPSEGQIKTDATTLSAEILRVFSESASKEQIARIVEKQLGFNAYEQSLH
jgi:hypothetical protein